MLCSLNVGDDNVHVVLDFYKALHLIQLRRMTSLMKTISVSFSGTLTSVRRRGVVLIRLEDDKFTKSLQEIFHMKQ